MTYEVLFAFFFLALMIFIMYQLLARPWWWGVRAVISGLFAVLLLWASNYLGGFFSLHIPVNLATVIITAVLGIPGLMGLFVLNFLLAP